MSGEHDTPGLVELKFELGNSVIGGLLKSQALLYILMVRILCCLCYMGNVCVLLLHNTVSSCNLYLCCNLSLGNVGRSGSGDL